jgi:hypothetical protein
VTTIDTGTKMSHVEDGIGWMTYNRRATTFDVD